MGRSNAMRLKTLIMTSLIILTIIPILTLGFLTYEKSQEILIDEISSSILKTISNAREYFIFNYINETEKTLYSLSKDPNLLKADTHPFLLKKSAKTWDVIRTHEDNIWFIYMGTVKGDIEVSPYWNPPASYDPRIRPWYIAAFYAPGEIVWSAPYVEAITGKVVVSASILIKNEEKNVGVLAIDTSSTTLSNIISSMDFGEGSYTMLIDKFGNVIAHTYLDYAGGNISNEPWFTTVYKINEGISLHKLNDRDFFIAHMLIPETGWKLISFVPKESLHSEVAPIRNNTIFVSFASILGAVLLSLVITNFLVRKANSLLYVMSRVENGDFAARWDSRPITKELISFQDKFNRMIITIENLFNSRQQIENRLLYMSMHDSLTNTFNRNYLEQEMNKLSNDTSNSVGIIVLDIDGLKFINDTFGHSIGDKLLISAAEIIKISIPENTVLSRFGGDEFVILVYDATKNMMENIINRIQDASKSFKLLNKIELSISMGYSIRNGRYKTVEEVFKEADNKMYNDKLHHTQSKHSNIVQTLMVALEARDFITEGHADRLQELIVKLAEKINYTDCRSNDLRLFSKFHDIGKVGIPDIILFKPGSLTFEEMNEMKRHSEIGYKIARSSSQLNHIADWILKHHERWNGDGYPIGLQGVEIPMPCRILAIADAYDAMTNDRPYRKAMSHEEAISELRKDSGIRFEPYLVEKFIELFEDERK